MTEPSKTKRSPSFEKGGKSSAAGRKRKRPRVGLALAMVTTLVVAISIGVTFVFLLPWYIPLSQPWAVMAGILLLLLGFVVLTNAFQALGFARALGRELYASKKESRLITVGLYAYTRHPIYLGVILLLFGWFFVTRLTSLLITTMLLLVLLYFVARWEERELTERFGTQYEQYRRAVPFFIPHPRLRRPPRKTPTERRRPPALPASTKRRGAAMEHKRRE